MFVKYRHRELQLHPSLSVVSFLHLYRYCAKMLYVGSVWPLSLTSEGEKSMLSPEEIMQLIGSLIRLLAGVGVFIVGMNFMSDANVYLWLAFGL